MASSADFMQQVRELHMMAAAGDMARYQAGLAQLARTGRAWPQDVTLLVTGMTATNTQGSNNWSVPGQSVFLVQSIRGIVQDTAPNSDTIAFTSGIFGTGTSPPSYTDRLIMKALNAKIVSLTTNQGSEPPLIDVTRGNPTVGDYLLLANAARELAIPRMLEATTQVQLALSLISADTAVVNAATNYGVILGGVLITL